MLKKGPGHSTKGGGGFREPQKWAVSHSRLADMRGLEVFRNPLEQPDILSHG